MNTNISVTISGIVFHIDENAYVILKDYLNKIGSYFSEAEGREEIISDVEARIAEIFQEKINEKYQVITVEDVNNVILIMGKPEDFGGDNQSNEKKEEKQEKQEPNFRFNRKLYRDIDNRWLGGVCAGLEHYFKINALWFRLIFLLTLALGGSGVLVYIILWIIVPKALTTAEKLEMRGEDVNIQNIEKIIREEADYFKKKMHDFKNETKDYYTNRFKQKTENKFYGRRYHSTNYDSKHNNLFFRIIDFFISVIKYSIKALLIFIGLIFLFVGLILLSLLLSAILGHKIDLSINTVHLSGISLHQITSIFIDGPLATLGMIGLILLIGIPFLMLVYNGIRFLFNLNQRAKIFNSICTGLWIFAFIIILFVGWQVYMEFNAKAVSKWNNHIMQPKNAVLSLNMNNYGSTLFSNPNDSLYIINNSSIGFLNDSLVFAGFPELKIERSYNDSFQLQIIRIAYGYNSLDAAKRAKNILLNVVQKDSVLTLDNYVIFNKKDKWRAQKMKILLKVPLGKSVEMPVFIYNNLLKKDENEQFNFVYGPANIKFEMTENGLVRC